MYLAYSFFDNEQFAYQIRKWLKTLRKYNASVIFATQSMSDIVKSPIFATILESCPSKIFLPYDKALEAEKKKEYLQFGLNVRQVEIIAHAKPKKEYYYTSPQGCRLFSMMLEACPVSLAYVGINEADAKRAHEIVERYGQGAFNERWMEYRGLTPETKEREEQAQ